MTATPPVSAAGRGRMRPRAWLDFVRDRVLAEIAANPSQRPYLGEEGTKLGHRPRRDACDLGHPIVERGGVRRCVTCANAGRRARRHGEPT